MDRGDLFLHYHAFITESTSQLKLRPARVKQLLPVMMQWLQDLPPGLSEPEAMRAFMVLWVAHLLCRTARQDPAFAAMLHKARTVSCRSF